MVRSLHLISFIRDSVKFCLGPLLNIFGYLPCPVPYSSLNCQVNFDRRLRVQFCERAMRAIGGMQSSMRVTPVIMRYCDQRASRVGIQLVIDRIDARCFMNCVTSNTPPFLTNRTVPLIQILDEGARYRYELFFWEYDPALSSCPFTSRDGNPLTRATGCT